MEVELVSAYRVRCRVLGVGEERDPINSEAVVPRRPVTSYKIPRDPGQLPCTLRKPTVAMVDSHLAPMSVR